MPKLDMRPAQLTDAEMLLAWRNDPSAIEASLTSDPVSMSDHLNWLNKRLGDDRHRVLIAEHQGQPVGVVRADKTAGGWLCSWFVSQEGRGQGVAKAMVSWLVARLHGPVFAQIKASNVASVKVAEHVGMRLTKRADGILHYQLDR